MRRVSLAVNGVRHELDLEPRELLVYVLRERLGLTGTNVGCDTSSCGSCTVLLNGESVKSCTVLGVQADGFDVTTIEGLADNGKLHPIQQAFHEHHGLQCGYCTPGWSWRPSACSRTNPSRPRTRSGTRSRATSAAAPATRTSSRRCEAAAGQGRGQMATTETRTTADVVGTPVPRKEDQKLVTGHGQFIDNINLPGMLWLSVVRSPYAHAHDQSGRPQQAARELEGVVAAFTGAELAADWAGSLPCAWPVTEDIKMPPHFPLAFDKARYVGDGVAVVVAETRARSRRTPRSSSRSTTSRSPAVTDVGQALDDDAPLVHDDSSTNECYIWKLDGRARSSRRSPMPR